MAFFRLVLRPVIPGLVPGTQPFPYSLFPIRYSLFLSTPSTPPPYSRRSPQRDPDHEPDELGRGPVQGRRMIASPLGDEPPDPGPIRKFRSWKNLRAARRASHRQAGLRRCRNPLPTQGRTAAPPSQPPCHRQAKYNRLATGRQNTNALPSAGGMQKFQQPDGGSGRGKDQTCRQAGPDFAGPDFAGPDFTGQDFAGQNFANKIFAGQNPCCRGTGRSVDR